jgi:1-pyrroline-5-carboxylate dehydrogenase
MGAVIDQGAFETIRRYLELARRSPDARVLAGGECDASEGWFIQPTVVQVTDPRHVLMEEEIFGPVLTVFVYADAKLDEALALCDKAGSMWNLIRWVSPRSIKENFVPPTRHEYPHMAERN